MVKMKLLFILTFLLILSPVYSEPNLEIKKIDKGSVIISELDNPAVFDFIINNKGAEEKFEIYSLISVSMGPKGFFTLKNGENKLEVLAFPDEEIRKNKGFFRFEYELKGIDSGAFKDTLLIKIVPLKEVLDISVSPLSPSDKEATITIKNKENTNIERIDLSLDSPFFEEKETISLEPFESKNITLQVNLDEKKLNAGPYILESTIYLEGKEEKIESLFNYLEKESLSLEKEESGIIIKTTKITKKNEGNIPTTATIEIKKNVLSRLFTINSPSPSEIQRSGLSVRYIWNKDLSPNESLEISSTTNYTFPLIIVLLVIVIIFLARVYSQTSVIVKKRVSHVRTKGGEFALKITLHVKAKKHADKIQIIDSLPVMTKLYEQFIKEPSRIDKNTGKLYWNIDRLNAGEERTFSYIIYSKLNVVGRFELPSALAVFECDGRTEEARSNKAFFIAEKIKN